LNLFGNLAAFYIRVGARSSAVVEALRYKSEGRGIDSRWCHWNFSLTNKNQVCILGVKSAGAATGWTVGDRILVGARFFVPVQTGPGTHPASCTMGTGSFPGVKWPGRGADHPPLSSAEVKKE
jgi:hypothetical protein